MIRIAPSILSCDFTNLKELISLIEEAGADMLHLDIMDGHFVPNISFGPRVVSSIKGITKLPLDVHLMIENPEKFISVFAQAGAKIITVNSEACINLREEIKAIKKEGLEVGVALNPQTPIESLLEHLNQIDMALLMTVEPGYGGQTFISSVLPKIAQLRDYILKSRLDVDIQVDGGINLETAQSAIDSGANILVAGEYIFGSPNPRKAIENLRKLCDLSQRRAASK
ncbi:MAG: ribulose-phosphate 3-epimerase [bacterium]